jgi:hypothetical protein
MATVENTICWVLAEGGKPSEGHWEDAHGNTITPQVGMTLDPSLCDRYFRAALGNIGLTDIPIPGSNLTHVVSMYTNHSLPRIKGYR